MRTHEDVRAAALRILLVNANRDEAEMYRTALGLMNVEVEACESAEDAITRLGRGRFDAVVSEVVLPGVSGRDLVRHLRALGDDRAEVTAIALSGIARAEDREAALAAGFDAYCAKPCAPDELVDLVRLLVARRRQGSELELGGPEPRAVRRAGTFEILEGRDGQFYFQLKSPTGEPLLTSERYPTRREAVDGVAAARAHAPNPQRFRRRGGPGLPEPFFVLRGADREVLATSRMYSSPTAREQGILAVQEIAPAAPLVDPA